MVDKSDAKFCAVVPHRFQGALGCLSTGFQIIDDVLHLDDADDRDTPPFFYFLNRRPLALTTFLTVEADGHRGQLRPGCLDKFDHLAHGCAGGNDIVDHQYAPGQWRPYEHTSLAVILRLLAVVGKGYVEVVVIGEGHSGHAGQRNTLVGRPQQHIEFDTGVDDTSSIEAAQGCEGRAAVEGASVEEIGALAPGLECEIAKAQHIVAPRQTDEFLLVSLHACSESSCGVSAVFWHLTFMYHSASLEQGWGMRVISFSADGVREAAQNGFFEWVLKQDADFICIQDLRCSEYDLTEDRFFPSEYNAYFFDDVNGKENGVAIYCRQLPKAIMTGLGFTDYDMQGRYIQADYGDISVGCLLAPQARDGEEQESKDRFFELLGSHLQKVRNKRRRFIIAGNWQLARAPIDVQEADDNESISGFLPQEQQWLTELLDSGYKDAFRSVSSDDDAFTFWPETVGEDGWRVDLQIISEELEHSVEHGAVYTGAQFSRHAPLIMDYDIEL